MRNALATGTVLHGVCRVEEMLGYGGSGIVYCARHKVLGEVAIKEYLPAELAVREEGTVHPRSDRERAHFEEGLHRFEKEARQLVVFRSRPNLVACREYFEAHGTAYMVMGYEDGFSLAELLGQREAWGKPFDEDDLQVLMAPMLRGLAAVHSAGALHRDIKPTNIIVRRADSQPVLMDFGAAKALVAQHSQSVAPFTPGYAAIEQVGEGRLGPWTDMYGVGALIWRIVAGGSPPWDDPRWADRPWVAPNPLTAELRVQALAFGRPDPLPSAREVGKGRYSERVLGAIDRCLVLDEEKRVQDCGEPRELLGWEGMGEHRGDRPIEETTSREDDAGPAVRPSSSEKDPGQRESKRQETTQTPEGGSLKKRWAMLARVAALLIALAWGVFWHESGRQHTGETWTNGLGMEFACVPAGEFLMGSESEHADEDESPLTRVRISEGFYVGKH